MPFSKDILMGSSGNQGAGDFYSHQIEQSLRLGNSAANSTATEYLYRDPSTAGNRDLWTISMWIKFNRIASNTYTIIKLIVKLFKNRSAELGDPNKLLFVAKLASPLFCGVLKNITKIKNPLKSNQTKFSILFKIFNFILQFQILH